MKNSLKQTRFSLKKEGFRSILGLFISAAIFFALPPTALSQLTAVVAVQPADIILNVGDTANISVTVQDIEDFYGFEIHLRYDPDSLKVLDSDPSLSGIQVRGGDLFDEDQGFLVRNQADNQSGELIYAFTLLAPATPMSGNGSLIEFEIEAIADGSSLLDLDAILASDDGLAIRIDIQDGRVTVGAGGTNQPTITLTRNSQQSPTPIPTMVSPSTTIRPITQTNSPTMNAEHKPTIPTETIQSQEPTYPLETTVSPIIIGITEEPLVTPINTLQSTDVLEKTDQTRSPSKSQNNLLWAGGIAFIFFLALGLIGGGIFLSHKIWMS